MWQDKKVYSRVFRSNLSAEAVWQAVEFMRIADRYIQQLPEVSSDYEALSVHGNRFLLHCIFQLYATASQKGQLAGDGRVIKKQVKQIAQLLHSKISTDYPDSPMYSLFKNLKKTRTLAEFVAIKM